MTKGTGLIERRKQERFWVQDGGFAVPRTACAKIGRIIDISRKGLAVRYIGEKDWLNGSSQVDILLVDNNYYLPKIQTQMISDCKLNNEASVCGTKERRCSLQFKNLSDHQIVKIAQFITKFTAGKVLDYHSF